MKAWLLDSLGGLGVLRLGEAPEPVAGPREVVLDVLYACLNPADRSLAAGQDPARPAFPHVLGRDAVGRVVAVGPGVKGIELGQEMVVLRSEIGVMRAGTFAQRVAVPVESLAAVPDGWSLQEAAGASLVYLTAYQALTQWGALSPAPGTAVPSGAAPVVLVTGASGGVGVATVQLSQALGHTVIALSRSPDKRARLGELGAAAAFDPEDTQWRKRAREFLGARRVDLAIDNIGGSLLPEVIDLLGMHGKVSVVGRLAGPVPQFNTASLFFRRLQIGGVAVGTYTPAESQAAWSAVVALLHKSKARPQVDGVFAFNKLLEAFERLAKGPMGKVLVEVGED